MKRTIPTYAIAAAIFLCLAAITTLAQETSTPYDAGQFTISPFYGLKATEFGTQTGKSAGGIALAYTVVDNIEAEVSALSYKYESEPLIESIDEAAVNFKGYLPFGKSGVAPYGLIGYTRDHALDDNYMNAGAGIAFRYKLASAFVDGQYNQNFSTRGNQFRFRAGIGLTF